MRRRLGPHVRGPKRHVGRIHLIDPDRRGGRRHQCRRLRLSELVETHAGEPGEAALGVLRQIGLVVGCVAAVLDRVPERQLGRMALFRRCLPRAGRQALHTDPGKRREGARRIGAEIGLVVVDGGTVRDRLPQCQLGRRDRGRRRRRATDRQREVDRDRHEQKVAAVMARLADVGVLRRLVGVEHHRTLDRVEQRLAVEHRVVRPEHLEERLGEHRVRAAAGVQHRLQTARRQCRARTPPVHPVEPRAALRPGPQLDARVPRQLARIARVGHHQDMLRPDRPQLARDRVVRHPVGRVVGLGIDRQPVALVRTDVQAAVAGVVDQ